MIAGERYYSHNSGRIYRYKGGCRGRHSLVIVKTSPSEPAYMRGRCLEYRGPCPLSLVPATDEHWK
jgi:hypothetical protein